MPLPPRELAWLRHDPGTGAGIVRPGDAAGGHRGHGVPAAIPGSGDRQRDSGNSDARHVALGGNGCGCRPDPILGGHYPGAAIVQQRPSPGGRSSGRRRRREEPAKADRDHRQPGRAARDIR